METEGAKGGGKRWGTDLQKQPWLAAEAAPFHPSHCIGILGNLT